MIHDDDYDDFDKSRRIDFTFRSLSHPRQQPKWLIREILPLGGVVLLVGRRSTGKSFLAVSLAGAVAAGQKYWLSERFAIDGPSDVLYVTTEGDPIKRFQGWAQYSLSAPAPQNIRVVEDPFKSQDFPSLVEVLKKNLRPALYELEIAQENVDSSTEEKRLETLNRDKKSGDYREEEADDYSPESWAAQHADALKKRDAAREKVFWPRLVVIDTLNVYIDGSENDDQAMRKFVEAAQQLGRELDGATVLILHHPSRGSNEPRGHTALEGAVDVAYALSTRKGPDKSALELRTLKPHREFRELAPVRLRKKEIPILRSAEQDAVREALGEGGPETTLVVLLDKESSLGGESDAPRALRPPAVEAILRELRQAPTTQFTSAQLKRMAGIPASSFNRMMNRLVAEGLVSSPSRGKYRMAATTLTTGVPFVGASLPATVAA